MLKSYDVHYKSNVDEANTPSALLTDTTLNGQDTARQPPT